MNVLFRALKLLTTWQAYCGKHTRVGHAYAEYAVHADYAHMRKYADADVNLIHINHIYNNCQKLLFFGKNMGKQARKLQATLEV